MHITFTRFPLESQLGGLETVVIALAKSLRERGHSISFMGSCPVLLRMFEENGFRATRLQIPSSPVSKKSMLLYLMLWPYTSWQLRRMVRKLKKGDALYMLSLGEKLSVTGYAVGRGIKVVWGEHEALQNEDGSFRNWLYRNPLLYRYRRFSRAVQVVTVSQPLQKQFEQAGKIHNITTVHNGIDADYFSPAAGKALLPLQGKFVVGMVARLREEKGVWQFLDVARELAPRHPDMLFILAGDGPLKQQLEEWVAHHHLGKRIMLLGEVPHSVIREVYRMFQVGLFLSQRWETFGLTALECMAMGKPTILTSAFGFVNEQLKTELLVVEPSGVDKVVHYIEQLRTQPGFAAAVAEKGRKVVLRDFSLTVMAGKYERLLMNLPKVTD